MKAINDEESPTNSGDSGLRQHHPEFQWAVSPSSRRFKFREQNFDRI